MADIRARAAAELRRRARRWTPALIPATSKIIAGFWLGWVDKPRGPDAARNISSIEAVLGGHIVQHLRDWYADRRQVAAAHPVAAREIEAVKAWADPLRDDEGKIVLAKLNAAMSAIVPGARLGFVPGDHDQPAAKTKTRAKTIDSGPER